MNQNATPKKTATQRASILARLRQQAPAAKPDPLAAIHQHFASGTARQSLEDLERFTREITAAHAEVRVIDPANWMAEVAAVCGQHDVITLACAQDGRFEHSGRFGTALETLQQQLTGLQVVQPQGAVEGWKDDLFTHFDAGLTLATGAIAETGTLLLCPGASEARTLSLVPPLHIVLLEASRIYPTLYALQQSPHWPQPLPTNLLLVSGPSKTADIQQTLAYGAHGPKALVVLVLNDLNLTDVNSGGAA